MGRKQGGPERADISPELHARIVELSSLLWEDNRSKMARDLGIDQPTVSRVVAGDQKPSGKFLERLANLPQINVGWLFLGQGEPLATPGMRPGAGGFRPLLDELLPGPPEEHRDRLRGVSYPVAAAFSAPSAYWFRLPPNSLVASSKHKVEGGDLMLLEADPAWTRRASAVVGHFCCFRIKRGKKVSIELCWVDAFNLASAELCGYDQYRIDTFQKVPEEAWLIVPADDEAGAAVGAQPPLSGLCLSLDRVVNVCVKLERPFLRDGQRDALHTPHTGPE